MSHAQFAAQVEAARRFVEAVFDALAQQINDGARGFFDGMRRMVCDREFIAEGLEVFGVGTEYDSVCGSENDICGHSAFWIWLACVNMICADVGE